MGAVLFWGKYTAGQSKLANQVEGQGRGTNELRKGHSTFQTLPNTPVPSAE